MYVIQIFKAKFETDISQGSEELTVSLPFTSFGERAMRIFRIRRKRIDIIDNSRSGVNIILENKPSTAPTDDELLVTAKYDDGSEITLTKGSYVSSTGTYPFNYPSAISGKKVIINVKYKDIYAKKGFTYN